MSDQAASEWLVGVDIGGTFTDIMLLGPSGEVVTDKVLSSPPDFATAVLDAIGRVVGKAMIEPQAIARVVHGTTVATNAILELDGAMTAFVTTKGFRDVLELGRLRRPRLYDLGWTKPPPLAARRHRYELDHRIAATGAEIRPIDPQEVIRLAEVLRSDGVEAVAVCLINSYVRPDVERDVTERLRELLPGVFVTASVDVSPEIQEFERSSTAVVNAYVGPVVERYISDLTNRLGELPVRSPFLIMQSSGGLLPARIVANNPVEIIESGPAAGVTGVQKLAQAMGLEDVVAFDMGGTTAKASFIEDGEPFVAHEYEVGGEMSGSRGLSKGNGYLIRIPSIDLAEIGAGGGSVISRDVAGFLHVGPESAGARPGPACYGQGGDRPTLTDANVVLGYMSPASLAGGNVEIDPDLATAALAQLARELGIEVEALARAAYDVAISNMTKVVKSVTSERGRDPRLSTMVAFGGAGPLYAACLAGELGISTIIVPAYPGLFSSVGLLLADVERHGVVPFRPEYDEAGTLELAMSELAADASAELDEWRGRGGDEITVDRLLDARYHGQRFELGVPLPEGPVDEASLAVARERFHREHARTYGRSGPDALVEFVNLRVRTKVVNQTAVSSILSAGAAGAAKSHSRRCRFGDFVDTPVMTRAALASEPRRGPIIVEEMDSTTLVPPGCQARVDELSNIVINWDRAA